MSKYSQQIVKYQNTFTGESLDDWNESKLEQAYDIEKRWIDDDICPFITLHEISSLNWYNLIGLS